MKNMIDILYAGSALLGHSKMFLDASRALFLWIMYSTLFYDVKVVKSY